MKQVFYRSLQQFVGIHTLLIGLFPFYLSVFLWNKGLELWKISFAVSLIALGFLVGMELWNRFRVKLSGRMFVGLSLLLEILMLVVLSLDVSMLWWLVGFSYGMYNGVFWITQRMLFFDALESQQSGKQFGNLQILVFILLQMSILLGGLVLENFGFIGVLWGSVALSLVFLFGFLWQSHWEYLFYEVKKIPSLTFRDALHFKDEMSSRSIFLLDGPLLYLEGFFWLITLYQFTNENYFQLGLVVTVIALFFAASFWFLKNSIDRLPIRFTYRLGVFLYVSSWVLRAIVPELSSLKTIGIVVLILSFFTSFFRLTFNKRFFDVAHQTSGHRYVYFKSSYSQVSMLLFFALLGVLFFYVEAGLFELQMVYVVAAVCSLFFLKYRISS